MKIEKYINKKNELATVDVYKIDYRKDCLKILDTFPANNTYIYLENSNNNISQLLNYNSLDNGNRMVLINREQLKENWNNIIESYPETIYVLGTEKPIDLENIDNMNYYELQELILMKKADFIMNVYLDEHVISINFNISIYDVKKILSCLK